MTEATSMGLPSPPAARSPILALLLVLVLLLLSGKSVAQQPDYQHGISLLHDLKYPAGFEHFDYVNPSAPKGGTLTLSTTAAIRNLSGAWGTGVPNAAGLQRTDDRLFVRSADEESAMYGLVADGIALSDDRKSLYVRIHRKARWHDGVPITTADVRFSFDSLMSASSNAFGRAYLDSWIGSIEIVNDREFIIHHRDVFTHSNLMALTTFPLRAAHFFGDRDPFVTTLIVPLGNGPYRVADFDKDHIVYERVKDYWARDLPLNRGRYNFDTIRYDVYRDATVAREAFRKGLIDVFVETDIRYWNAVDKAELESGRLRRDTRQIGRYIGQKWAIAFNLERPLFRDVRVREALTLAYDFEWQNRTLQFDSQRRATSYFAGSRLASRGLPSPDEVALLEPYRDQLPERLFTEPFELPVSNGQGLNREGLSRAQQLLREAGWTVVDGRLQNGTGQTFTIEIATRHAWAKRMLLPFIQSLGVLGIEARVRLLDQALAVRFMRDRRFDMVFRGLDFVHPPMGSLASYFSSKNAGFGMAGNLPGIREDVVDDLIALAQNAPDMASATAASRALDRVLLWGFYHIPLNMPEEERFLYWDKFSRPDDAVATFEYLLEGQARVIDGWWANSGSEPGS